MKTYLSQDKLSEFKDRLLQMKKETEDALEANTTSESNKNLQKFADYCNHPADMGTEQFEQQKKSWFAPKAGRTTPRD